MKFRHRHHLASPLGGGPVVAIAEHGMFATLAVVAGTTTIHDSSATREQRDWFNQITKNHQKHQHLIQPSGPTGALR